MAKEKAERFVVEFKLKTDSMQEDILNKRMEIARRIYNQCVSKTRKQYKEMIKTKRYRAIETELRQINSEKEEGDKTKTPREKELRKEQQAVYKEFGFSEYGIEALVLEQGKAFSRHLDSTACAQIGANLWRAWEKYLYREGKDVHFRKYGKVNSISGKYNTTGITIQKNYKHPSWEGEKLALVWGKTSRSINLTIPIDGPKTKYEEEALECEIANNRIIRKTVDGKNEFFVQIVFKGTPPVKLDENGEMLHPLGEGLVDIKLTSQEAIVTKDGVTTTFDLADRIQPLEDLKQEIDQAMTRSQIATNPERYNADGTTKTLVRNKSHKWKRSKKYKKLLLKKQSIEGKQANVRKQQHEMLANTILAMGDTFVITHPDFKKRQKDEGKTIAKKAPAMFLTILKNKASVLGANITTQVE